MQQLSDKMFFNFLFYFPPKVWADWEDVGCVQCSQDSPQWLQGREQQRSGEQSVSFDLCLMGFFFPLYTMTLHEVGVQEKYIYIYLNIYNIF